MRSFCPYRVKWPGFKQLKNKSYFARYLLFPKTFLQGCVGPLEVDADTFTNCAEDAFSLTDVSNFQTLCPPFGLPCASWHAKPTSWNCSRDKDEPLRSTVNVCVSEEQLPSTRYFTTVSLNLRESLTANLENWPNFLWTRRQYGLIALTICHQILSKLFRR